MPNKNGNGSVTDLTVEILKDIRRELHDMRVELGGRLDLVATRVDVVSGELVGLREETRGGFRRMEQKLASGGVADEHIRERILALEAWAQGQGYHVP